MIEVRNVELWISFGKSNIFHRSTHCLQRYMEISLQLHSPTTFTCGRRSPRLQVVWRLGGL